MTLAMTAEKQTQTLVFFSFQLGRTPQDLPTQIGNKTECALLGFVLDLGEDYREIRRRNPDSSFTKVFTFNSARKSMSTIVPLGDGTGGFRIYTKGASEVIMKKCAFVLGEGGRVEKFTKANQDALIRYHAPQFR